MRAGPDRPAASPKPRARARLRLNSAPRRWTSRCSRRAEPSAQAWIAADDRGHRLGAMNLSEPDEPLIARSRVPGYFLLLKFRKSRPATSKPATARFPLVVRDETFFQVEREPPQRRCDVLAVPCPYLRFRLDPRNCECGTGFLSGISPDRTDCARQLLATMPCRVPRPVSPPPTALPASRKISETLLPPCRPVPPLQAQCLVAAIRPPRHQIWWRHPFPDR